MPSALWCVTNGRAIAPPYSGCSTGVSTSTYPSSSRNARIWRDQRDATRTPRAPRGGPPGRRSAGGSAAPGRSGPPWISPVASVLPERRRPKRLGEQRERLHPHGHLPGLGRKHRSRNSDIVAQVEQLEISYAASPRSSTLEVELDPAGAIGEMGKRGLAVAAARRRPAGQPTVTDASAGRSPAPGRCGVARSKP